MKPAAFDYYRPNTLKDAVDALDSVEESEALSGGQSLMPMINMRLARPSLLVDLAALDLRSIAVEDERIVVDALVTHRELECDSVVRDELPLVSQCARHIGHRAIRERGTIGGSVSHADPTAELAVTTVALGASMIVQGTAGQRRVRAEEFFIGSFSTALESAEVVVGVEFPRRNTGNTYGFSEYARRPGDFAEASAACVLGRNDQDSAIVVTGAGSVPNSLSNRFRELHRSNWSARRIAEELVASIEFESNSPEVEYRRQLIAAVVCDALIHAGWTEEGGNCEG